MGWEILKDCKIKVIKTWKLIWYSLQYFKVNPKKLLYVLMKYLQMCSAL